MDSKAKATSRAHSRLASLGRIRSRGSIRGNVKQQDTPTALPALPSQRAGETYRVKHAVPVSHVDASLRKRPDTSTLSNTSSESSLSDEYFDDIKSIEERPSKPVFWLTTSNVPGDAEEDEYQPVDHYQPAPKHKPRMMHQTSSRLLRMTEDDRPFTRVCIA